MSDKKQSDLVQERFTRTAGEFAAFSQKVRAAEAAQLLEMLRGCMNAVELETGVRGGRPVANAADAMRRMRAVDVACGPGTFTLAFAPHVAQMTGLDITAAILRARAAAEREGLSQIEWLLGNAEKLPWEAASFDLVTTAYSLHHIGDAARAVSEMARVLRPGGWLALVDICVPDAAEGARNGAAESVREFDADVNNAIEIARDASHVRTFRPAELRALAERAGLRVKRGEPGARPRSFDDWMQIAGWKRSDAAYTETRRLMEQNLVRDRSGFAPSRASGASDGDLQWTQWSYFFVARKAAAGDR